MGKHMEIHKMSETVYQRTTSDCPSDNSAMNNSTTFNFRRQSTDNLPLISVQFIEDLLKTESESVRQFDLKSGSPLDKSFESLIGLPSPIGANSDKRNADQMFNYFFKKIKSEEASIPASELEGTSHETVNYRRKSVNRQDSVTVANDELTRSTVCDIEEETMVSALSSSESSCCSPGETPSYAATPTRRSIDSFDLKADDSESQSSLCWEPFGDPIRIEVIGQMDNPLTLRVSYSLLRHRASNTLVRVGDSILLRDPNQQWFERLPQVAEIVEAYQDVPVEAPSQMNPSRELHVTLRRYYRSDQLLCVLPDIAIEMASREAVIFSSSHIEPFQQGSEFIGPCLLLSLNAFYRFWAEITRIRHGRTKRRRIMPGEERENWHDWLSTPDRVFVICGEYDHIARDVEVVVEPLLDFS